MKTLLQLTLFALSIFSPATGIEVKVRFENSPKPPAEAIIYLHDLELDNAALVLWYVGEMGIYKAGADFYRDEVFSSGLGCPFFLYDLAPWACLNNGDVNPLNPSKWAQAIDGFNGEGFFALSAAEVFRSLMTLSEDEQAIMNTILTNELIYIKSSTRVLKGKDVQNQLLSKLSIDWICDRFAQCDAARAYSALQYVEALIMVRDLVLRQLRINPRAQRMTVVFFLPNDELEYYLFDPLAFERDLKRFLSANEVLGASNIEVDVVFVRFIYGDGTEKDRPYRAPKGPEGKSDRSLNLKSGSSLGSFLTRGSF